MTDEIVEKIEEIQRKFEDSLSKPNLNYDSTVLKRCEKVLSLIGKEPKKWPKILHTRNLIDIYYETLYYFYVLNVHSDIIKDIPIETLIILMSYKPLVYFIQLMNKTYDEAEKFKNDIFESIMYHYGSGNYMKNLNDLIEIIKLEPIPKEELSAISYFHYFIGFKFPENFIGIKEIPKDDKGSLVVNITYNLKYHEKNVYVYHQNKERIGTSFLTTDIMKRFNPIELVEIKEPPKKLFEKIDIRDENRVVLRYNDENFTIPEGFLSREEAEKFVGGAIPIQISTEDLMSYASNRYYNLLPQLVYADIDKTKLKLPKYGFVFHEVISPIYEYYSQMKKFDYKTFIQKVLVQLKKGYIDKREAPVFDFYLTNYHYEGDFRMVDFLAYLQGLIEPNEN